MGTSKSLLKQIQKYTDFYLLPLLYIQCEVARGCSLKDSASSQKVKFCPSGKKKKKRVNRLLFLMSVYLAMLIMSTTECYSTVRACHQ